MAISGTLQRVEDVIETLMGRDLEPDDAHPVLLELAAVLGRSPYAVVGPRARFRWRFDELMVEAGVDRFLGNWEVGYRAFPYEPDVSRGEDLAFTSAGAEVAPPYEWSLELADPQPRLPPPCLLLGWPRIATELGYLLGSLPQDLATVPPEWFDGVIVLSSSLGGIVVEARSDRHGLTLRGAGAEVHLDPDRAYRAGASIGQAWVAAYTGQRPGDLALGAGSTARPFTLLAVPGAGDGDVEVLIAASFADLVSAAPSAEPRPAPVPAEAFLAAYATPEQATDLVDEAVVDGVTAFLQHHDLAPGTGRPGVPELRAETGWRVRLLSGTIQLTLLESRHHPAAVLDYTRRLLDRLEAAYGSPWGSARDSQGRLARTWRVGDLAIRAGSSGSSVVVEITSYEDLLIHHFG